MTGLGPDHITYMHSLSVRRRSTRPLRTCTSRGRNRRQWRTTDGCRSGPSGKRHAVVDINGLPEHLALTTAKALDSCLVLPLLADPEIGSDVACGSVDRGYGAEWTRALDGPHCSAHRQTSHRNEPGESGPQRRNPVEPLFNKIEQRRRVAIATSK